MGKFRDKLSASVSKPDLFTSESTLTELNKPDLFISDLHLCASRPHITQAFLDFLQETALKANALYILGDFFEYWAGDDDIDDAHIQSIITGLRALADANVKVYFMHGNRDFLISKQFCAASKITLLSDPALVVLHQKRVLLSHGDALCTDDIAYQTFRQQVRNKEWQQNFLNQPLHARKQQIESIRIRSEEAKSLKSAQIMDVNQDSLMSLLADYNYPELFIHGHTHRPNQHQILLHGHVITRHVLGDWYEHGSYLAFGSNGCKSIPL